MQVRGVHDRVFACLKATLEGWVCWDVLGFAASVCRTFGSVARRRGLQGRAYADKLDT